MQIERTFAVAAPIDRVWQFIMTPAEVGPCMPGCHSVEITGPGKYSAIISVKVGPIKTTFNFNIETVEERPPEYAVFSIRGDEGGSASRVTAENTLTLRSVDKNNTEVTYASKVNIVGRLGKFAGGVMQKMAESMSDQFVRAFRAKVEPESQALVEPQVESGFFSSLAAMLRKLGAILSKLFKPAS
ncbi:MAG: carbon monoxide dehydrogenase subunit G [Proteobacteria bacterium]|nr:carbon monoxide dehydrogenase subunit G [Pseudomonadota bacterium]